MPVCEWFGLRVRLLYLEEITGDLPKNDRFWRLSSYIFDTEGKR